MGIELFDAPFYAATYLGASNEVWTNGSEYNIHIQKMKCGRYQLFKSLYHYKELPGHKVYPTLSEIYTKFKINGN